MTTSSRSSRPIGRQASGPGAGGTASGRVVWRGGDGSTDASAARRDGRVTGRPVLRRTAVSGGSRRQGHGRAIAAERSTSAIYLLCDFLARDRLWRGRHVAPPCVIGHVPAPFCNATVVLRERTAVRLRACQTPTPKPGGHDPSTPPGGRTGNE